VVPSDSELAVLPARFIVTTHNQTLGRLGEDAAARWYEEHGYAVVERNWRGDAGELDLVAVRFVRRRPQIAAFVEVKTRTSQRFGAGVLAVGHKKQERIRRLSGQWLSEQRARIETIRFDIVDVDGHGHLTVYEAAF
jgi:putative endonuclease